MSLNNIFDDRVSSIPKLSRKAYSPFKIVNAFVVFCNKKGAERFYRRLFGKRNSYITRKRTAIFSSNIAMYNSRVIEGRYVDGKHYFFKDREYYL